MMPRGCTTFFMLNSTGHEFQLIIKTKMLKNDFFFFFKLSYVVYGMLMHLYSYEHDEFHAQLSWAW